MIHGDGNLCVHYHYDYNRDYTMCVQSQYMAFHTYIGGWWFRISVDKDHSSSIYKVNILSSSWLFISFYEFIMMYVVILLHVVKFLSSLNVIIDFLVFCGKLT